MNNTKYFLKMNLFQKTLNILELIRDIILFEIPKFIFPEVRNEKYLNYKFVSDDSESE